MKILIKHSRAILTALAPLCILVFSHHSHAQSVDSCMTAKGEEAVQICKALIAGGNRNAEVYYQLSSQLYQLGRSDEAGAVLDSGLSIHRANNLLTTLRNTLDTDSEEQAALRASAKRNESAINRGQLKLICLTKTSQAGIEACRGYLSQTNVDGDRIRARAQAIATALTPSPTTPRIQTELQQTVEITEDPAILVEPTPPADNPIQPPQPAPLDATQLAMRELVRDIQRGLSSLGFNVGTPDGINGPRTVAAVREFYRQTQSVDSARMDDQTLSDVEAARSALEGANSLLVQSRQAASTGAIERAIDLLASAQRASALFTAPTGYRQNLDLQLAQHTQDNNNLSQGQQHVPDSSGRTEVQIASNITTQDSGTSPEASYTVLGSDSEVSLLQEIESLTSTLALRRANNKRHNQSMRSIVDELFK